jgi:hypothetical protein
MASRVVLKVKRTQQFAAEQADFMMDCNTLTIIGTVNGDFVVGATHPMGRVPVFIYVIPEGWYAAITYGDGILIEVDE